MILCASQPCYLAWMPLLDRIAQADVFVVMDAVQFEKGSYVNRNKIPLNGKDHWLTVPVLTKDHLESTIAETKIDWSKPWLRKHLKSVEYAHGKQFSEKFEKWKTHLESLSRITCVGVLALMDLEFWLAQYQIKTPVKLMPLKKRRPGGNELILDLMADFKADTFLAGPLFKNYVNEELWRSSPYKWEEYKPRIPQTFTPYPVLHSWLTTDENPFLSSLLTPTMRQSDAEEPSSVPSHRDFRSTSSL